MRRINHCASVTRRPRRKSRKTKGKQDKKKHVEKHCLESFATFRPFGRHSSRFSDDDWWGNPLVRWSSLDCGPTRCCDCYIIFLIGMNWRIWKNNFSNQWDSNVFIIENNISRLIENFSVKRSKYLKHYRDQDFLGETQLGISNCKRFQAIKI